MNKIFMILFLFLTTLPCFAEINSDEVADRLPRAVMQPKVYNNYDFSSTSKVPIKLKIVEPIKSESEVYEGQFIDFRVARDVVYNEQIIVKRGTDVTARVSVIITSGMNGIPASIIFKDFKIEGLEKGQISSVYEAFGQDRSLIVFPLKWALTILPPTGTLTNFIKGGHVKIKSNKLIKIYYYPNWV